MEQADLEDFDEQDAWGLVTVGKGELVAFELSWHPADAPSPPALDERAALAETERAWTEWSGRSTYRGPYQDAVNRSLIMLKAMVYAPSGGIIAAPTAGLLEEIGGVRNWDYRFCWLRDATLTLEALMVGGYVGEAEAWRTWLLRAVAGAPEDLQIMYGVEGERRLTEFEIRELPGYEDSRPVRIGNAASEQFQLDVGPRSGFASRGTASTSRAPAGACQEPKRSCGYGRCARAATSTSAGGPI